MRLRDECLNMDWFGTGQEAQTLMEQSGQFYNIERAHVALNYQVPEAFPHTQRQQLTA